MRQSEGAQDGAAELRRKVMEREGAAETAQAECSSLRRQAEAGQREVAAARQAHYSLEQHLQSQLASARSEAEASARIMSARLHSSTEQVQRYHSSPQAAVFADVLLACSRAKHSASYVQPLCLGVLLANVIQPRNS